MERTTIDGVTTFWEDLPGQFSAALVFGVGCCDATFRTAELPHLVEHLAMDGLPTSHVYRNASVDLDSTEFIASGQADEVVAFLDHVCGALESPPLDRMEHEIRVLQREDGRATIPCLSWGLASRFGLRGPGLVQTRGAEGIPVTHEDVSSFIHDHFVRANAVLVLSKPPPDTLRLTLPDRPRAARPPLRRLSLELPALIHGETPVPVITFELPPDRGASASMMRILDERILEEARHRRGLIYDTALDAGHIGEEGSVVGFQAECDERDAAEVLRIMWDELNALAAAGPTDQEVERVRRGFDAYLDDESARFSWLQGQARAHLLGSGAPEEEAQRSTYATLTSDQIRAWARHAVGSTLAGVPEHLADELLGLPDRTEIETVPPVFVGDTFKRRIAARAPREVGITLNDTGISNGWVGGHWSDVIGLGSSSDLREVVFATGRSILAQRRQLRDVDRLYAILDERVGHLAYPLTLDQLDLD